MALAGECRGRGRRPRVQEPDKRAGDELIVLSDGLVETPERPIAIVRLGPELGGAAVVERLG
jgi:hypothetical protein